MGGFGSFVGRNSGHVCQPYALQAVPLWMAFFEGQTTCVVWNGVHDDGTNGAWFCQEEETNKNLVRCQRVERMGNVRKYADGCDALSHVSGTVPVVQMKSY